MERTACPFRVRLEVEHRGRNRLDRMWIGFELGRSSGVQSKNAGGVPGRSRHRLDWLRGELGVACFVSASEPGLYGFAAGRFDREALARRRILVCGDTRINLVDLRLVKTA